MLMDALTEIQRRFYKDFPAHPKEGPYNFAASSTFKPTAWSCPEGSLNQIKGDASVSGDMRITPFYPIPEVRAKIEEYVADINAHIETLCNASVRGPFSKYALPDVRGKLTITWEGAYYSGVACNLESPGYKALSSAFKKVTGKSEPFSLTGSLPLVRELQEAGFDLQLVGFGHMSVYHGLNEYCTLQDMHNGFKVLADIVETLNKDLA